MKHRVIIIAGSVLLASAASAQGTFEGIKGRAMDQAISMAKKSYDKVIELGKPYAEKLLRATPKYYKEVQGQVLKFGKELAATEAVRAIEDKRKILLQMWQLRAAVDVMALSDPLIVSNLTGLGIDDVAKLRKSMIDITARIKRLGVL